MPVDRRGLDEGTQGFSSVGVSVPEFCFPLSFYDKAGRKLGRQELI